MERPRYEPFDLVKHIVYANLYLLEPMLRNKKTKFVFDSDGVKINSPKRVLEIHNQETGLNLKQHNIDQWEYVRKMDLQSGLSEAEADRYENLWYQADVLAASEPYLFMRPLIRMLNRHYGSDKLYVLTARRPELRQVTVESYRCLYPQIPEANILMRSDNSINAEKFKHDELKRLAKDGPCIFVEDSFSNLKSILLNSELDNCLCIHIPLGLVQPEFHHERLMVMRRFPHEEQGMRPLFELFRSYVAQY